MKKFALCVLIIPCFAIPLWESIDSYEIPLRTPAVAPFRGGADLKNKKGGMSEAQ